MLESSNECYYKDGPVEVSHIGWMSDEPIELSPFLKDRLEAMLILLDRHEMHLAAAWLEQAINSIPVGDEQ